MTHPQRQAVHPTTPSGTHLQPSGESLDVDAGDVRLRVLRYRADQDAPPLILLPGITTTAFAAEFIAAELTGSHTVYVPDLRGRGRSGRAAAGRHTLRHYVSDVAALVETFHLAAPALLGHSLGARIAAWYAVAHPGRRSALVLVDPPLSGPGRRPYPTTRQDFLDQLDEVAGGAGPEQIRSRYPAWPDRELRIRAQELRTCDRQAVVETLQGFHSEDFHELWSRLDGPAVLVYGERSPVVTAQDVQELGRLNPEVPLVAVPGAGHMVPWDNPRAFLTAIRPYLRRREDV
ncbi:alpha/beta fold hydrolase [Nonomuraea sp. NPDC047897]|uniref:alpha/beta fold hydrolase n=1 Tax=Nonomuraea sp. NPDC047897 TaxID=3364346 RepID=UPI00371D4DAF